MKNSIYEQIGFKLRSIRNQLGLDQQEFASKFQIPRYDLERFENGSAMPTPTALAYLSVISVDPSRALAAVEGRKILDLTPAEDDEFETLLLQKIASWIDHEGGRNPNDKILWVSSRNGRLPDDEYRVRYPPKSAVKPCLLKCLYCKRLIDIPFEVLELHESDNESIYDIDCPHCWKCNAYTARTTIQKLVSFRRKCQQWINPPAAKSGRVSTSLRFKVLERYSFRCFYCGATPQHTSLHVDHMEPVNEGGTNAFENLVAACAECNLGKGNRSIEHGD